MFVDGDFWHGRILREQGRERLLETFSPTRRNYWIKKISATVARDDRTTAALRHQGWTVVRIWESQIAADLERVPARIERIVRWQANI